MLDTFLLEDLGSTVLEEGNYLVVLEASDINEMKKEIFQKLKNSRSPKERKKWLTKLKNLNKVKRIKDDEEK